MRKVLIALVLFIINLNAKDINLIPKIVFKLNSMGIVFKINCDYEKSLWFKSDFEKLQDSVCSKKTGVIKFKDLNTDLIKEENYIGAHISKDGKSLYVHIPNLGNIDAASSIFSSKAKFKRIEATYIPEKRVELVYFNPITRKVESSLDKNKYEMSFKEVKYLNDDLIELKIDDSTLDISTIKNYKHTTVYDIDTKYICKDGDVVNKKTNKPNGDICSKYKAVLR